MSKKLLCVDDALHIMIHNIQCVDTQSVALQDALGYTLAEDLTAHISHPLTHRSAMDGYAVRKEDLIHLPHEFVVIEKIPAGHKTTQTLGPFEAARVYTGSMIPKNATYIVIQENITPSSTSSQHIIITQCDQHNDFIRRAATDFQSGEKLLDKGTPLNLHGITLASAMNYSHATVYRKPRIGVLSTGDELCMPGGKVSESQTINSNFFNLKCFIESHEAKMLNFTQCRDNVSCIDAALHSFLSCDMIVTIGGASVGEYDLVRKALHKRNYTEHFHGIAMRPGKPLFFGHYENIPVLGLPGNPVSSAVCSEIFLKPAIAKLTNRRNLFAQQWIVHANHHIESNGYRQSYLRACIQQKEDGRLYADTACNQDSAHLSTLYKSDGLLIRPINAKPLEKGEKALFIFFSQHLDWISTNK